jgi:hypothetical protein
LACLGRDSVNRFGKCHFALTVRSSSGIIFEPSHDLVWYR